MLVLEKRLKLFLVERIDINIDYDEYDSFVVVAYQQEDAIRISPSKSGMGWPKPEAKKVKARFLGYAKKGLREQEIIISSFKAG